MKTRRKKSPDPLFPRKVILSAAYEIDDLDLVPSTSDVVA